jgi:hypothetical protein
MARRLRGDYQSRDVCGLRKESRAAGWQVWHGRRVICMHRVQQQAARLSCLGRLRSLRGPAKLRTS